MKHLLPLLLALALPALATQRQLMLGDGPTPTSNLNLGLEFPGAKGTLETIADTPDTPPFQRISYDVTKGAYVAFRQVAHLAEGTTKVTFKVRSSLPKIRVFVRTMDSKRGQQMRRVPTVIPQNQWTEITCDLTQFDSSWGGPNPKKIFWPLNELVVGTQFVTPDRKGTIDLKDIVVTTTASITDMPNTSVSLASTRFGSLFYPDEIPEVSYKLVNRNIHVKPNECNQVRTLKDWKGNVLYTETAPFKSSTGTFKATPAMLKNLFGAFELEIKLIDAKSGTVTDKVSTWFGRLQSPNPKPCPWIGTHLHAGHGWGHGDLRFLDIFSAVGYGVVREEFGWAGIEREKGKYVLSDKHHALVDELYKRNIRFNLLLTYGNKIYDNPYDPEAFGKWAAFMAQSFKGKVNTFEIWNEPHNFGFKKLYGGPSYGPNATWLSKFVEFTKVADKYIRTVQPDAHIGVTAEDIWLSLKQMVEEGIANKHNTITFHPYCHGQPRPERSFFFNDRGKAMREVCAKNGGASKFAITEVGWTTYDGPMQYLAIAGGYPRSSYVHQAQYLMRLYLSAKAFGVEFVTQYDFKNDGPNRSYTEHNFGVVHEDYTPKPALLSAAYLCRLMEDAQYVDDLGAQDNTRLYQFKLKNGEPMVAAYVVEGELQCNIPVKDSFRATDLQGNPVALKPQNGILSITLTEMPVYLFNVDVEKLSKRIRTMVNVDTPNAYLGNVFPFSITTENLTGTTVKSAKATITLTPAPEGKNKIVIPNLAQNIKNRQAITTNHTLDMDIEYWKPFLDKKITMDIVIELDGVYNSCSTTLIPKRPLDVLASTVFKKNGAIQIPVTLFNRTAKPMTATVNATSRTLKDIAEQTLQLPPSQPTIVYLTTNSQTLPEFADLQLDIRLETGWKTTPRYVLRNATIPKRPARIPLAATPVSIALPSKQRVTLKQGDQDVSAYLSRDDNAIHIEVRVKDDVFFQPFSNHGDTWRGDSLQCCIAPVDSNNFLEATVALLPNGPNVILGHKLVPATQAKDITATIVKDGSELIYTVAIPWTAIPNCKKSLRFSLLVNDNDGAERKGWTEFHSGVGISKFPAQFGTYSCED